MSLILAATVVMGSPGPSTISLTAVAAAFGPRRSLPYMAGLILGTLVVLLAVLAGFVAALLAIPALATAFALTSTVYLLYLAFRIATAPPLPLAMTTGRPPSLAAGVALGVTNPKAYVAIGAVAGGATLAAAPALDALLKAVALGTMVSLIHLGWMLVGASFARALGDPRRSRIVNVVLALALVASSLSSFLT